MYTFGMKKLLILLGIILIGVVAYFTYQTKLENERYKLVLNSEINYSDRHFENIVSEAMQNYLKDELNYEVKIGIFKDKDVASKEMTRLIELYNNPGMVSLGGKYVKYTDFGGGGTSMYFYQSENKIIMVTSGAQKDLADQFVVWFFNKHKPL